MLKYVDTKVVFQEIPDEITLAINISGCPNYCKNCHSPHLADNIGTNLDAEELGKLINSNKGITCVCFMGGDNKPYLVLMLARIIKIHFPELKVGWYSGKQTITSCVMLNIHNFDYIKVGPYIEELGPLNSKTTNQKLYKVENEKLIDITKRFWND